MIDGMVSVGGGGRGRGMPGGGGGRGGRGGNRYAMSVRVSLCCIGHCNLSLSLLSSLEHSCSQLPGPYY